MKQTTAVKKLIIIVALTFFSRAGSYAQNDPLISKVWIERGNGMISKGSLTHIAAFPPPTVKIDVISKFF